MTIYTTKALLYQQFNQKFISSVLPLKIIEKVSKILVYGEDPYGYQRSLNEKHVRKISSAILKGNILPTSIILSADSSIINENIENGLFELEIDTENSVFRVVDGQHRLKGLRIACGTDPTLENFALNVIIILTKPENRVLEVNVFRDINSLAKKIKTDLTLLANYNYELLNEKDVSNFEQHVSIKVAYYLNEKNTSSVWHRAIQFDVNADHPIGIIGVSAFTNSLDKLTKAFLKSKGVNINEIEKENRIKETEILAEELSDFVNVAWKEVRNRWSSCFSESVLKEGYDYFTIYYNIGFYIQKTTGVNAINSILFDCINDNNGIFDEVAITEFKNVLGKSKIKRDEWRIGGDFSGLTSETGFKKAKQLILFDQEKQGFDSSLD